MTNNEIQNTVKQGEYKFVAQLVPPLLGLSLLNADVGHAQMGFKLGLMDLSVTKPPYKPIDPTNFRAGRLTVQAGGIITLGDIPSVDFSNSNFSSTNELQRFINTVPQGSVRIFP